jgi:lysozyme
VGIHLRGVAKCIHQPLKQNEWVAIGSWTYNVGVGAACNSTLVRKINAGVPWCAELLKWDRAGGRKVRGLTRRRQAEFEVCEGRA